MMISAVARIFEPGCKVDTVPVVESPQGLKKSTALKALFDPWFTDDIEQLGSKDAAMQVGGIWWSNSANSMPWAKLKFQKSRRSSRARLIASGRPTAAV